MVDLESMGHEKHFAKRVDQFGFLDQKLWHFELPSILCNHLIITPQPIIR
jgi:hypothetical protein